MYRALHPFRRWLSRGAALLCVMAPFAAQAATWAPMASISATTTLVTNSLCYTDGMDIACNGLGPAVGTGASTFASLTDVSVSITGKNIYGPGSLVGAVAGYGANTAMGVGAMASSLLSGGGNSAYGSGAMGAIRGGAENVAIGDVALAALTNGGNNTAVGASALNTVTTGSYNSALGRYSLFNNTGEYNTATGAYALRSKAGGGYNTALGYSAGYGVDGNAMTGGTLLGAYAGQGLTTGNSNTLIGYNAGGGITTGAGNIVLGVTTTPYSNTGNNQLNIGNAIWGDIGSGTGHANKIGINVTSPTTALQVSGTVSATRFVGDGSGLTGITGGGSATVTSGVSGSLVYRTSTGALIASASLVYDDVNGLGLGTAPPGGLPGSFGLAGDIWGYRFLGDSVWLGNDSGIRWSSNSYITSSGLDNYMVFGTNNTDHMYIASNGNVGISTDVPNATLEVNGTISATNLVVNGVSITGSGGGGGDRITSSTSGVYVSNSGVVSIATSGTLASFFNATGLVTSGISTTGTAAVVSITIAGKPLTLNNLTEVSTSSAIGSLYVVPGSTKTNFKANGTTSFGVGAATGGATTTAMGNKALWNNTAADNTAMGYTALLSNSSGYGNTSIGSASMGNNETGIHNTAVGGGSLGGTYTVGGGGDDNAAFGSAAGYSLSSGSRNTLLGSNSGYGVTTGNSNTTIGYNAGATLTTGSNNIMIGSSVVALAATGSNQLNIGGTIYGDIGRPALTRLIGINVTSPTASLEVSGTISATALTVNGVAVGGAGASTFASLTDVSSSATAGNIFGPGSLTGATSSVTNSTAFGQGAFASASNSGYNSTAIGYLALNTNSAGIQNTAVGANALRLNTAGNNNTAYGASSLQNNTTGVANAANGVLSLGANTTGGSNTANGFRSLPGNTTGSNNVATGALALFTNTTGSNNTANGSSALQNTTTGSFNAAFGYSTGLGGVSAAYNGASLLGSYAGQALTTGNSNTLVGYNAGGGITTGSNNLVLGTQTTPYSNTGSNQLNIGNAIWGDIGTGSGNANKIGLNVTSPTAALEVSGTISATSILVNGQSIGGSADRITSGTVSVVANGTTGNVGLGTSAPTLGKMQIAVNAAADYVTLTTTSSTALFLQNTNASGTTYQPSQIGVAFGYTSARQAIMGGTYGYDFLDFYTAGNFTAPRMRIDSNGLVGIGTTTPSSSLHVVQGTTGVNAGIFTVPDTNTAGIRISSTSARLLLVPHASTAAYNPLTQAGDAIINFSQATQNSGGLVIAPWSSTAAGIRINANGNVGIGTAIPVTNLDVSSSIGATNGTIRITMSPYTATTSAYLEAAQASNNNNKVPVIINRWGGTVGVGGLDTPSSTLQVSGMIQMGYDVTACDANRLGAIKYQSGEFYLCRVAATGWEALSTISSGAASDRIVSGTAQVIAQSSGGIVQISATALYLANGGVNDAQFKVGANPSGNRYAYVDLIGDSTYNGYGLRIIRNNGGANTGSYIQHRGTGALNLQTQDAGPIVFQTSSTEAMRIDPAGNVGIGNSTPTAKLDIAAGALATTANATILLSKINHNNGNGSSLITLGLRDAAGGTSWTTDAVRLQQLTDTTYQGYIQFNGNGNDNGISFGASGQASPQAVPERMRINSSGNVGIGTTAPGYPLDVSGSARVNATSGQAGLLINRTAGNYGSIYFQTAASSRWALVANSNAESGSNVGSDFTLNRYDDSGTYLDAPFFASRSTGNVGIGTTTPGTYKLYVNGNAYSTGTWSTSDARYKENVQPMTGLLAKVSQLRPVTFTWKKNAFPAKDNPGEQIGLIAQEVEKIYPELVHTNSDGYKAVAYDKLGVLLLGAVKDLKAQNDDLKAQNTALEKRLERLEAKAGLTN